MAGCNLSDITFRDILDSMPHRVWVMDMCGEVIWENRVAREGQDDSSLTSSWWAQIKGDHNRVKSEISSAMSGHSGVIEFQRQLPHKEVWVRAKYNPVYSESGGQIGVYGIESDVTVQKEALPRLLRLKSEAA